MRDRDTDPTLPPAAQECVVWRTDPVDATPRLLAQLDAVERRRWKAFVQEEDRRRFLAAHALVRLLAGRWTARDAASLDLSPRCRRCGGGHGPPRIPFGDYGSGDIQLSISHSGGQVLVAATRSWPVGVDVERLPAYAVEDVAVAALSPTELATLADIDEDGRRKALAVYWTRKEALLKATGDGIAVRPTEVEMSAPGTPPRLLAWRAHRAAPGPVFMADIPVAGCHVAAVAVLTETEPEVSIRDGHVLL